MILGEVLLDEQIPRRRQALPALIAQDRDILLNLGRDNNHVWVAVAIHVGNAHQAIWSADTRAVGSAEATRVSNLVLNLELDLTRVAVEHADIGRLARHHDLRLAVAIHIGQHEIRAVVGPPLT